MTVYVALLRAINVGGTGTLPMKRLVALCEKFGLDDVRTYIQSGNVVFDSRRSENALRGGLAKILAKEMGKEVGVTLRTAAEMKSVLKANPFRSAPAAKVGVAFLSGAVPKGALDSLAIPGKEEVRAGRRVAYVHYPDGMGRSRLKLPAALGVVTVRNINTVGKLAAMMEG